MLDYLILWILNSLLYLHYLLVGSLSPLSLHDALKHHLTSLETDLILLQLEV